MKMSNQTYDVLKFVAQIVLPALATLYVALGDLWGLPKVMEVAGTIMAVDTFLGALLGFSSTKYNSLRAERGCEDCPPGC